MELDPNWKPPEGMFPSLNYRNKPEEGEPTVGYAYLHDSRKGLRNNALFFVGKNHETAPALPLRVQGEHWSVGWDIPTRWAIDANGQCYMDGAHGGAMCVTTKERLLKELGEDGDEENEAVARASLGFKPRLPDWIATALAAGWTPPPTFKQEDYE